ncbi:MAG: calcium-binding protein, partial [Pseudomonadota bacterium]
LDFDLTGITTTGIDEIRGTSLADSVIGSDSDDNVTGGGGNDVLTGGLSGNDTLSGGSGNDQLEGGVGNDTLFGGSGDDTIFDGEGRDFIDGGDGSDTIFLDAWVGDPGVNTVQDSGTSGTDTLVLQDGWDDSFDVQSNFSAQTSGIEIIDGTGTTGEVFTSRGQALDFDLSGIEVRGVDAIRGSNSTDSVIGSDSDDTVFGLGGNDTFLGGAGNDTLYGGSGNDRLEGGTGDDTLLGGTGDDTLLGEEGHDIFTFEAGSGNDAVFGGAGGSFIDALDLGSVTADDANPSWVLNLEEGSIVDQSEGLLELSQDANGYIEFEDGSRVDFYEIEQIQW